MNTLLKEANGGTAQAEFVCIDSSDDKEGYEYRPNKLVSSGLFTPTPRINGSLHAPAKEKHDLYLRRLARQELDKKDTAESKAALKTSKTLEPLDKAGMLFVVLFVLAVTGVMLFTGHTVYNGLKTANSPTYLDLDKFTDQADVDIFFEKDPAQSEETPKYKFRDSVSKIFEMGAWRIQEVVQVPICGIDMKVVCGDPLQRKFATTKCGTIKRNAYCRWIIRDHNSVIRECLLVQKEGRQDYTELFGDQSFCRIDFDLPAKNPASTDLMVPPEQGPFDRFRRAGKKVSGGMLFVLRRMVRATRITYHRAVLTLKELLNLTEPRVKFLGGEAHSFAHQKIWLNMKVGYSRLRKRLFSLLGAN